MFVVGGEDNKSQMDAVERYNPKAEWGPLLALAHSLLGALLCALAAWGLLGACLRHVQGMSRPWLDTFGACLGHLWGIFRAPLGHV